MFGSVEEVVSPDEVTATALDAMGELAHRDVTAMTDAEVTSNLRFATRLQAMADALMVDLIGAFDGRALFAPDGAFSTATWLTGHTDTSRARANTLIKVARQAKDMPLTMDRARNGRLGLDKVRVLAAGRGVSERTAKEFDSDEQRLLDAVTPLPVDTSARLMRNWAAAADPEADETAHHEREQARKLHLSTSWDGMGFLDGLLTAEANAIITTELEAIANDLHRWGLSTDAEGKRLTAAQLRHDSLLEMARRSGCSAATTARPDTGTDATETDAAAGHDTGPDTTGPTPAPPNPTPTDKIAGGLGRPLLHVLVDIDTLEGRTPTDLFDHRAEAPGTGPLSPDTIRRLLCDAGISRIVTQGHSLPLDVGAMSRTATPAMWRALLAHAGGCEFPGCGAPPQWTQAHHLTPWHTHPHTAIQGLMLICGGHHTLLHKPGWQANRRPDGTITVTRPHGPPLTSPPRAGPDPPQRE